MAATVERSNKGLENRRFQRVDVAFSGRYMLPSKIENDCRVVQMSPGNLALETTGKAEIGDHIVIYVDKLGRFDGVVERVTPGGFAMAAANSAARRDRLADTLTWFANRHILTQEDESRKSERVVPFVRRTMMTLADGKEMLAKITDISRLGVGIESPLQPSIGTEIRIGRSRRRAAVTRHFAGGFACAFIAPFDEGQLDEATII